MATPTPTFEATKRKGRFLILDAHLFNRYFKKFKENEKLRLIVEKWEETESDPLRKYYWAVVAQMISDHTGHSKEAVHEAMKIKYASHEENGMVIVKSVFSKQSKMKISKKLEFIKNVRAFAFDFFDLAIPDPEGKYVID